MTNYCEGIVKGKEATIPQIFACAAQCVFQHCLMQELYTGYETPSKGINQKDGNYKFCLNIGANLESRHHLEVEDV